ncbi:MAG: hypothetical protein ACOZQL_04065 [Myxococcota bacterium]
MQLFVLALLGGLMSHPDLGLALELPEGWRLERDCGVFVSGAALCRQGDRLTACSPTAVCPERVGVLWVRAPAVLASLDDEKRELQERDDGGASWASSRALPDGWVLTWGGPRWPDSYPFKVSRRVGARVIECSGEATTLAGQEQMIAACKSLREVPRR